MRVYVGPWDVLLLIIVSMQATVLAYLSQPRWKAFILSLPLPFTVASLAVGQPIGATNALGIPLFFLYTQAVRVLHYSLRVSIIPSIVLSALGYVVLGTLLAAVLPDTEAAFWLASAGAFLLGMGLLRCMPHHSEPAYRSPLPVWLKLPTVMGVILFLIVIKGALKGFATCFPMVGVVAAYEARHSLWTLGRQVPLLMMAMVPLQATCRLTQAHIGLGPALLLGWAAFLIVLLPLTRIMWSRATAEDARLVTS